MPIVTADLLWRGSVVSGTGGNQIPQTTPGNNRGKNVSTTVIPDAVLNNVFADVSGDQNLISAVEYQCLFVHNNHATLTLTAPVVWLTSEVAGGATVSIAIDNVAATAIAASGTQACQITFSTNVPPATGAFSAPTTKETGLSLGNLLPGRVRAVWIRRTASNTGAVPNDGATWRFEGDTAP